MTISSTPSPAPLSIPSPGTSLVTAATGKTGRRVAERLTARGHAVRRGTRTPRDPDRDTDRDTRFDWTDDSTWDAALDGAVAAYLAYVPDLCVPGAVETVERFATRAVDSGVRRLVLLSGRGEPEAARGEEAVLAAADAAGAGATVLRCNWFAQNFSENFLLDGVLAGSIVLPAGHLTEPFVDVEDVADVAVAALTGDGHAGQVYELSGPRSIGFAEVADLIGQATGRSVDYVSVGVDEYLAGLRAAGLPEQEVSLYAYLLTELFDGRNSSVVDGVERALGREPRTFESYVRRIAAMGAWAAPATKDVA